MRLASRFGPHAVCVLLSALGRVRYAVNTAMSTCQPAISAVCVLPSALGRMLFAVSLPLWAGFGMRLTRRCQHVNRRSLLYAFCPLLWARRGMRLASRFGPHAVCTAMSTCQPAISAVCVLLSALGRMLFAQRCQHVNQRSLLYAFCLLLWARCGTRLASRFGPHAVCTAMSTCQPTISAVCVLPSALGQMRHAVSLPLWAACCLRFAFCFGPGSVCG
jgi:hypothetical protein